MSILLSYPTAASPTTEVTLSDHVEQLPSSRPLRKFQTAMDTDSGTQLIYDWGTSIQAFTVTLTPLTTAEKNSIESFYDTTVDGRVSTWQYTDALGTVYTVRFAMDLIEAQMTTPTLWTVPLTLRTA